MRITDKDLEAVVKRINIITNSPLEKRVNNEWCIGCYHLSYACGGVELQQITNDGGGTRAVLNTGYTTKRDLYEKMQAFINGLESKSEV